MDIKTWKCPNPTCSHSPEQHTHLTLRLTGSRKPCEIISMIEDVGSKELKKIEQCILVIVAFEVSDQGVEHTHSYVITTLPKITFRERIKAAFFIKGNQDYSLKLVQIMESALSYTIKCGDYVYSKNFPKDVIATIPKWIFRDAPDDPFKTEKQALINRLKEGLPDEDFLRQLIRLYVKHDRNIYLSHLKAEFYKLSIKYNRRSPYEQKIMDYILDKI